MGFQRNDSKNMGGYSGPIPEGVTVPCLIAEAGGVTIVLKNGKSAGKECDIYDLELRVLKGTHVGSRIWDKIFVNVARNSEDPSDPDVHGSHKIFCELCDNVKGLMTEDNSYPVPDDTKEWAKENLIGKVLNVVIGQREYFSKKKNKMVSINVIKNIIPISSDQKKDLVDARDIMLSAIEEDRQKKAAASGGTGLDDDDDDLPF